MNIKKIIALFLTALMVLALAACTAQNSGGIGGEERISHSASENRHLAPVKMRNCFVSRIEFRKCLYRYGCHDTRINIRTLEGILNRKRINNRRKHSHVIRTGVLHRSALTSAPYISGTDYNSELYAFVHAALNDPDYLIEILMIKDSVCSRRKRLSRKLK